SSFYFFVVESKRRHTRLVSDWSSDVCSSDLRARPSGRTSCTPCSRRTARCWARPTRRCPCRTRPSTCSWAATTACSARWRATAADRKSVAEGRRGQRGSGRREQHETEVLQQK